MDFVEYHFRQLSVHSRQHFFRFRLRANFVERYFFRLLGAGAKRQSRNSRHCREPVFWLRAIGRKLRRSRRDRPKQKWPEQTGIVRNNRMYPFCSARNESIWPSHAIARSGLEWELSPDLFRRRIGLFSARNDSNYLQRLPIGWIVPDSIRLYV